MDKIIGIYKITNKINNKAYVGQSTDIKKRWINHKCCNGPKDLPLYKDIKKYGKDNFIFEVLEKCTKEELNIRELFYINKYDTVNNGYNPTDITDNPFYHKEIQIKASKNMKIAHSTIEHKEKQSKTTKKLWQNKEYREKVTSAINSKESKEKMSKASKNMWANNKTAREKITKSAIQRASTKEFREAKSKIMKEAWASGYYDKSEVSNNLGKHFDKMKNDAEYKEKMSQIYKNNRPNAIAVDMIDIETGQIIKEFEKIADAQKWITKNTKYTKADKTTISRASRENTKYKTAYGYKWKQHI